MRGFKNPHKELARGWHRKLSELKPPRYELCDENETLKEVGRKRYAIKINYFHLNGKPRLRPDRSQLARFRLYEDPDRKYSGRLNDPVEVNFPPGLLKLLKAKPDEPIYFAEGEHKADDAVERGLAAVAFQGITGWQSKGTAAAGFEELRPYVKKRRAIIPLDSDVPHNVQSRRFAAKLGKYIADTFKMPVEFKPLPQLQVDPAHIRKSKTGMDDYIHAEGLEAFEALPCVPLEDPQIQGWLTEGGELNALPEGLRVLRPVESEWLDDEPPPIEWAVIGLLAKHEITAIAGKGGAAKTSFTLTVAIGIALGRDVLNLKVPKARKVLYMMLERHGRNFRRRVHRAAAQVLGALDRKERDDARLLLAENLFPQPLAGEHLGLVTRHGGEWIMNVERIDELAASMKAPGIEVAVIDTISRLHGGSGIDDALALMIIRALERLVSLTNCALIFLAHVGKDSRNDQYSLFGSSVWVDNTSGLIAMETVDPAKLRNAQIDQPKTLRKVDSDNDLIIRLEQRRSSEYGTYPVQHYVVYREGSEGGQMHSIGLHLSTPPSDVDTMGRVQEYFTAHGSFTKRKFHKEKMAGPATGEPTQKETFDRLVKEGLLIVDESETTGAYTYYQPAKRETATRERVKSKRQRGRRNRGKK